MKIAIVGSGVAGLSAATRLAAKGHQIDVFEANDYAGGKLTAFSDGAYRFDAGPSLFTMPSLLEELSVEAGLDLKKYFDYQKLDTACHYFYPDGTHIKAYSDKEKFAKEVESKTTIPAKAVIKHLDKSAFIYEHTHELFMERSLHKWSNYFKKNVLDALLSVHKLQLSGSMHDYNSAAFEDSRLVQLFDRYATYNGSNPYKAPGVLNIIPHLEHGIGTFFPKGGMHSITKSLVKMAEDLGVSFHFNEPVTKISVVNGSVRGLETDRFIPFDTVVSNMDVVPTFRRLLADQKQPEKTLKQERSSSALIFYWGVKQSFPQLDLHNIFFSDDYKNEFNHIFDKGTVCDDPTVYINISSKYEPSDAPEGCENWFVMINVPSNTGQDWDQIIDRSRENIKRKLSQMLGIDLSELIETESILDPRKMEAQTSSYQGALYGTSSNNKFSAFLRHPNFSQQIKGLYFCGGSVHPGGGIPLCLLSGKIVSDLIL